MSHGGKREGAGRPLGAATLRSQEIAAKAIQAGITPLEVMLDNMRFAHSELTEHLSKLMDLAPDEVTDYLKAHINLREVAQECAKDAAPYVHAKLANMEVTGADGTDLIPDLIRLKLVKPDGY